ncbi:TIGR04141 family sporadically distributed protein [Paraburkholderia sp. Ac-20347]|uniref:TIGR04141 family sporadically distributed protein n=1 Tax=Paraburkholderia sp. Ac-20347 TaxID=2703892 RepID=UPI001F122A2C|nr:TIGR04141 family sporadically distributed protein [Paraburkholderia sp. Ac-20347]
MKINQTFYLNRIQTGVCEAGKRVSKKERKQRKERLTIYRIVGESIRDELIVKTDMAKEPVPLKIAHGQATLYVKIPPPLAPPGWTTFLLNGQDIEKGLFSGNRSEGALLIVRDLGETFALSFGMGYHLVNQDHVERDFGLRVTLNSVDPDKLRSLDKASYDDNWLNTRNQSPRDADIYDLRADWEMDMVHAVTGASSVPLFGDHVTGRDALSITPVATLDDLRKILSEAIARRNSPLPDRFAWMDNVHRIKDRALIQVLDDLLDETLKNDPDDPRVWMGEPEIVDWERQAGYSFDQRSTSPVHSTLRLSALAQHILDRNETFCLAALKTNRVHVNDANGVSINSWSAHRCLYAELDMYGEVYILRNGDWHSVESDFMKKVDQSLRKIEIDAETLPLYNHANEGDYNAEVATRVSGIELMDKQNIAVGGPFDKIEFCDLVRNGKDLIHVKYYRSSATLSHLFAQGLVSGEAFVKHEEFRKKLNGKLPKSIRLAELAAIPNSREFRVVYAIATSKNLPVELPFFSKISLKNAALSLQTLGYKVALAKIEIDPLLLKTKTFRAAKTNGRKKSGAST